MRRRKLLAGLGGLAGAGGIFGSAAFSRTAASRDLTVAVAEDDTALLRLEPSGSPNGEFARQLNSGTLALDFTGSEQGGQGVGTDSVYRFDDVFRVTNQGTQPVYVWGTFGDAAGNLTPDGSDADIWLYPNDSRDTKLRDSDDAVIRLGAGEVARIGVHVDTHHVTSDQDLTLTLNAGAEKPDGSSVTEPIDAGPISVAPEDNLQAALYEAQPGGTVELEPGTHRAINNGLSPTPFEVTDPGGLTIRGTGQSALDTTVTGSFEIDVTAPGGNGLTVQNLAVRPVDDPTFDTGSSGFEIRAAGSSGPTPSDVRFENVSIRNHTRSPALLSFPDGVAELTIRDSEIKSAGTGSGSLDGMEIRETATDVEILSSVFYNNENAGIAFENVTTVSNVSVEGSNVWFNNGDGIFGPPSSAGVVEVSGSYIDLNGGDATTGNVTVSNAVNDPVDAGVE